MKKIPNYFLFVLLAALYIINSAPAFAMNNNEILKFEQRVLKSENQKIIIHYKKDKIDNLKRKVFNTTISSKIKKINKIDSTTEVLEFQNNIDKKRIIDELKKDNTIQYVEENKKLYSHATPNDFYFKDQWSLENIMAEEAWEKVLSIKKSIVIAVIDTGIDVNHTDLKDRIAPGGYNFILNNTDVYDVNGHGTAVAGVIAAKTNNSCGIAGVAGNLDIKILPLKTAYYDGSSYLSDVIRAIDYAIEKKVDVINLSMGSSSLSNIENRAIQKAIEAGIVVVASAGNEGSNVYDFPASYDNVISVGSIYSNNSVSSFSNYNDKIDVVAPGEEVISCSLNDLYTYNTGTSFSAPIVASIAGILKGIDPTLTPNEIEEIIRSTAIDQGSGGKNNYYGYGLANLYHAVEKVLNIPFDGINWPDQTNIPVDKVWTVKFNKPLDAISINNSNIYITHANGNEIPIEITINEDKKFIIVTPDKPYDSGETYYLFITNTICSQNSELLSKSVRMQFSTN